VDPRQLTGITDLVLGAEALLLGALLLFGGLARRLWGAALLFLGVSALAGGCVILFWEDAVLLYFARDFAVAAVTMFAIAANARHFLSPRWHGWAARFGALYAAVFCLAVVVQGGFLVVVGLYAPVMIGVLVWHAVTILGRGSLWMMLGLVASFLAAGALVAKVNAFAPLEAGGLYHVIMMVSVALLFRGGLDLKDRA
jgi:hypothetical protein